MIAISDICMHQKWIVPYVILQSEFREVHCDNVMSVCMHVPACLFVSSAVLIECATFEPSNVEEVVDI